MEYFFCDNNYIFFSIKMNLFITKDIRFFLKNWKLIKNKKKIGPGESVIGSRNFVNLHSKTIKNYEWTDFIFYLIVKWVGFVCDRKPRLESTPTNNINKKKKVFCNWISSDFYREKPSGRWAFLLTCQIWSKKINRKKNSLL